MSISAIAATVCTLLGLGTWGGYELAAYRYQPKIEALRADNANLKQANADMEAATAKQNESIENYRKESEKRAESAKKAIAAAKKESAAAKISAHKILMQRPPAGADPCLAASGAIDEMLKRERLEK